ncbi:hypothetical protein [Kaistella pullorum]|uniref:DUF4595 domain-containing protein n=1 Tax=Kaistella pullorum TaxID=2763074 RepID=A0ABR8WKG8_9FLAO|nr:hypothetical protein [Kaistella pullorum]MBD8017560.1 hypothetical protein [Kaistella pullorum]
MQTIKSFLILIISLTFVVSCQPGRDENGDLLFGLDTDAPTGGGGSGTSKLLHKLTAPDGSGGNYTITYNYALGKLTNVRSSDNSVSYDLIYDNNNISKIKVVQDDGGTVTTTNFDISYTNGKFTEAKGTGVEDSGNSFNNTITASYAAGKVSKIVSKMQGIDISDPTVTYDMFTMQNDITYSGNNISVWKSTMSMPPITIPPIVLTANFSDYDSYKNPFNTLPEVFNIVSAVFGTDTTPVTAFSANNYIKVSVEGQTVTYTYTYDADGYPTKAAASENAGTLTFEYTK